MTVFLSQNRISKLNIIHMLNIKVDQLVNEIKEYINLRYELLKLEMTERSSVIGSSVFSMAIIVVLILFFLFLGSIGLSIYISELLDCTYAGFLIVAGAYLLLGLILFLGRKKLIEEPLRDKIIRILTKKENDTKNL